MDVFTKFRPLLEFGKEVFNRLGSSQSDETFLTEKFSAFFIPLFVQVSASFQIPTGEEACDMINDLKLENVVTIMKYENQFQSFQMHGFIGPRIQLQKPYNFDILTDGMKIGLRLPVTTLFSPQQVFFVPNGKRGCSPT